MCGSVRKCQKEFEKPGQPPSISFTALWWAWQTYILTLLFHQEQTPFPLYEADAVPECPYSFDELIDRQSSSACEALGS